MKRLTILALGISLLAAWLPASAHHGFATEYDRSKALTLVGKLTRVEMENPHGWLYIDAKDPQGKVVNWALELPGPAVLRRNGFDSSIYQTSMTFGEVVTVTAYAARDGSKHAFGGSLTRADGQTVIPLGRLPTLQSTRRQWWRGYGRGQGQGPQKQQQQ